jgi:hypothetical protein
MRKFARLAAMSLVFTLLLACLAVPAGAAQQESFEARYKNYSGEWAGGALSPIKMKLEGDTLTFDYSPVFYIQRDWSSEVYTADGEGIPEELLEKLKQDLEDGAITEEEAWETYQALWAEYPQIWSSEIENYTLSDEEIQSIIDQCVAGFKAWEGVYEVYGREITVKVGVHPALANSRLCANVLILPQNDLGTWVPGSVLWKPNSPFLHMFLKTNYPRNNSFEDDAMHEFGHVLGLFDAYGYGAHAQHLLGANMRWLGDWLLPEAPPERAPWDAIMRSRSVIYPTDIEMILWAWKDRRLQLYTESVLTWLGAEVSPAFSD